MAKNVTHSVAVMVVVVNSEMLRSNVQLFKTLSFGNRKPGANGGTAVSTKHFGTPDDLQEAESSNFKENRGVGKRGPHRQGRRCLLDKYLYDIWCLF